ncbi:proteasome subunit alpha type-5-like [Macrobrachium nipponense]|uniref:proteasome subunit alpha type-5-like n=1 Tax=Macrobrachium nipponense TaxID=159736 RepID=UPI0030C83F2C
MFCCCNGKLKHKSSSFASLCHPRQLQFHYVKMFLTRSEYDRGVNTFSPEGRLFQVEYAIEAIKLGSTAIGIQTSEGVVLAVEKRITSPLMIPSTIEKIVEIDSHIGCAVSGLVADSRTLVDHARVECANHWFVYNENMKVESVAQAVSNLAIRFGDSDDDGPAMSRPFGVAMLFAGLDKAGAQLYHMDPSGTFLQFGAKAIGSGSEGAQQSLQESYHKVSFCQSVQVVPCFLTAWVESYLLLFTKI